MTIDLQSITLLGVSALFFIGVVGSFLPVIPGCIIVWVGILVYKLVLPDSISWTFVLLTGGLTVFAQVLDYLCTYWGAKKFGGSWRGGIGALLGALIGPFVLTPLIGLILGPVIGAVLGEISAGKNMKESGKAGFGTLVGGFVSFVLKLGVAVLMVAWFYFQVFTTTPH